MLANTNSKVQYRVSPKAVGEVLKSVKINTKKTHSKSFFISLKNRNLSVSHATKTA
ncbi:hypothetical protein NG754_10795 [Aliarcobacter cryaerophilus]|jgi:hypothetical protein|uniref:hypothetical protein n=1 Tax=Aliarcobacter cryaerophilus TaxID=28198 RepID=UPI003DA48405